MNETLTPVQHQGSTVEALRKTQPGGYHCCAPEPGFPFTYISDRFLSILGWTEEEIRTEFDNKFQNLIHPEDMALSDAYVHMVDSEIDSLEYKDLVYRLKAKTGYRWVSNTTIKVIVDGKSVYQGVINDVTDYIEQRERREKELEVQRSRQLDMETQYLEILSRDFTSVYHVNLDRDTAFPLKQGENTNSSLLYSKVRKLENYTELVEYYGKHFVAQSSQSGFLAYTRLNNLKRIFRKKKQDIYRYHSKADPEGYEHFEMHIFRLTGNTKETELLMAFRRIDDALGAEQRYQEEINQERRYLEVLSQDYTTICRVDLDRDLATVLKLESKTNGAQMAIPSKKEFSYAAMCRRYCKDYLMSSGEKELLHFLSPETLRTALRTTRRCTYRYHSKPSPAGYEHFEVQAIRLNDDPDNSELVMAFRHIDDIVSEEQMRQFEREEQLEQERNQREVFKAIGNIYHAIFRLDLRDDSYTVISCREDMHHYYDLCETSAQGVLDNVCKRIVNKKYRKRMRRFYDLKTLPDRLRYQEFVDADCITKAGNWHRVRLIAKRRDENGEVTHALYVTQIINDEKRYQEQLIARAEYANQANQSKSSFVSQVAHDIRTPMNSIFGFLEIAEANLDDREKLQYSLEKIRASGEFLKALVNDVLDISRMEDGKVQLQPVEFNVVEMLEELCASMENAKFDKKQFFRTNIHNIIHERIVADALRLEQIYANVLSNAIKYTPDGGMVSFSAWQEEIPDSDRVRLIVSVADTGVGMSQEFMKNMFGKFERSTDTRINKVSGYGLGLTIVKFLVDFMGGTMDVNSEVGEGTTFTISLDVPYVEGTVEAEPVKPMDYGALCSGLHLLVAEDNELNREVITELLGMYGITCDCVQDGSICVECFSHSVEGTYDAILMDLQMPVLNGIEATKQIRKLNLPWARKIPIVAMTANAMKEDMIKCLEAGMTRHLSKPVDMEQMLKTLAEETDRV